MDARYDVDGPTSMIESMAGSSHLHDSYTCPYSGKGWHRQAVALRQEAKKTASSKLHDMFWNEAHWIIQGRKATREEWIDA
jgi:hypothetical protein